MLGILLVVGQSRPAGAPKGIDCVTDPLGNLDAHRFTVQNPQDVLCRNFRVSGEIQNGRHCKRVGGSSQRIKLRVEA